MRKNVMDIDDLREMAPFFKGRFGTWVGKLLLRWLRIDWVNTAHGRSAHLRGAAFTSALLRDPLIDLRYEIHNEERLERLPEGAFVTVSNHPIGSLDGIILIDILAARRPDFKVMVNGVLTKIWAMEDNFISVVPDSRKRGANPANINGVRLSLQRLREGHPIFHGPFKVSLTFEEQPTPDDAFYYQHQFDEPIPKSLPMWRVQTKGYRTDMRFNMGLVSHPWGYEDSPEAEYISGGVSTKSPDAVAIGRHGNFLHWGFIASPLYMTEEAKVVFANAVAYIAQFRGPILARRFDGYMPTRTTVKDMRYLNSHAAYNDELKFLNNMKHLQDSLYGALAERQAKGEKLGAQEEVFLKGYQPMEVQMPPFEAYLQGKADPELFAQFGTDVEAYARYYDENAPYFYGGGGSLVLDEDAKAWGIPNNDKRLLDKAISCLEEGVETERAQRVLSRYTLCAFATPAEWRKWYDRHEDKLFFTESGGWFFMVDGSRLTPGNDYSVLEWRQAPAMEAPASRPVAKEAEEPTADEPVRVAVTGKAAGEGLVEVTVRFALYKGFHVYREVGAGDPYIPLEVEFLLPEGCVLEGGLKMPAPKPFSKTGTTVYEGKVEFTQLVRCGQQPEAVRVKLSYQCCDSNICLPPKEEVMEVRMQ